MYILLCKENSCSGESTEKVTPYKLKLFRVILLDWSNKKYRAGYVTLAQEASDVYKKSGNWMGGEHFGE